MFIFEVLYDEMSVLTQLTLFNCQSRKTYINIIVSFVFILSFLSSSLHAQQTTTVVRIVDGDTLKVHYREKEESIRLITEAINKTTIIF